MTLQYYDLTPFNSSNTHTLLDPVLAINTASGNLFGMIILCVIWVMIYMMASRRNEQTNKWIISSFVTSVVGVLMFLGGLITWYILIIPLCGLIVSVLIYYFE